VELAGKLLAPHYVRPLIRSCGIRPAFVRSAPAYDGTIVSELLPGEEFALLEVRGHWAWGYCRIDHYVGYVEAIELVDAPPPTHIVHSASAPILPEADAGVPALAAAPLGARLTGHEADGFLSTDVGFIPQADLRPIDRPERDFVAVAERLIGAPYRLGGRTSTGIDCSGLVQVSLMLCGLCVPRDCDQQRMTGERLADGVPAQRGDLVFFHGHVGIMADEAHLLHANGTTGSVAVEPLDAVLERMEGGGNSILERRRIRI
jgi:hypothetical protein